MSNLVKHTGTLTVSDTDNTKILKLFLDKKCYNDKPNDSSTRSQYRHNILEFFEVINNKAVNLLEINDIITYNFLSVTFNF